jgi:hypothetical protein
MTADDALIEAIAQAIHWVFVPNSEPFSDDEDRDLARAAYDAMVEQLGLTEETRTLDDGRPSWWVPSYRVFGGGVPSNIISKPNTEQRRLVSKWVEVP